MHAMEKREFVRTVLVMMCYDFCGWMFRRKITQVEVVGFVRG